MGGRTDLRLPRRRHQRAPRLPPGRREPAPVRPGPSRGDERVRGRRLRQVHRQGRRLHGHLRPRRHPPPQRPLRRQARSRPGGRHRRPAGPHLPRRQLPAGGRPHHVVQGRRPRVRAHGDPARAVPQSHRPRHAHRHDAAHADLRHRARRPPGGGVRRAQPLVQDGAVVDGRQPTPDHPTRRGDPAGRRRHQRRRAPRHPGGPGCPPRRRPGPAGRREAGGGRRQGPARQGRGPRRPSAGDRPHRPARLQAQRPHDERLRHVADDRIELPVQPVPPRLRAGPGRADRHRSRR